MPTRHDAMSIHLRLAAERSAETERGARSMKLANAQVSPRQPDHAAPAADAPPVADGPACPCDLGLAARFSPSLARACAAGENCGPPWQATRKR